MSWRDDWWAERDQADVDAGARKWDAFERALLNDDQVRERRMLDDEERRCDSVFEQDWEDDDGLSTGVLD